MNVYSAKCPKIILLTTILLWSLSAQETTPGTDIAGNADPGLNKPEGEQWFQTIDKINFIDSNLRDIIQALAIQNDLNIVIDKSVDERITLNLNSIKLWDFINYLADDYNLKMEWKGDILTVRKETEIAAITEEPSGKFEIIKQDSLMSIVAEDAVLSEVMKDVSKKIGKNILIDRRLDKKVSGTLYNLTPYVCLKTFLQYNEIAIREQDGIYHIYEAYTLADKGEAGKYKQWISISPDKKVSLDITDCPINYVIQEISGQTDIPIINYSEIKGSMTAKTIDLSLDLTLDMLLKNTNLTYRFENGVYFIGDRNLKGMATRELIRLNHIKSSGITELLPRSITSNAEIKEVKELNSIMVIATRDVVEEARKFIQEIDHVTPQILIEAVVVDYQISNLDEFSLKFGIDETKAANAPFLLYPFMEGTMTRQGVESRLTDKSPKFVSRNIGILPHDFYMQLKAMEQEGYAKIQSKPHIATLNGHKASIIISTTQYYIFESEVIYPTSGQPTTQTSQRFEKIAAEVKLEITPWISADGEVTVEIHPEFSTPVGSFTPDVPPTINSRILDSTVRLSDGETIVLGGLIQSSQSNTKTKFPILGSIPYLGALFRGHEVSDTDSELVIYLTPHINMAPVDLDELVTPETKQ